MKARLLLCVLCLAATAAHADVKVGAPAPDFTLADSHGQPQKLSALRGKYVVLEWTNHECPFVKKHYGSGNMPSLQKMAAAKGVTWWSIVSSAPGKQGHVTGAQADELTKSRGAAPAAVLLDEKGEVGHLYGAKTTPHMFVIDPKGTLVYMGGIDSVPSADPEDIAGATPYVKVALEESMAGKPVSTPVTKSYGCSVKY